MRRLAALALATSIALVGCGRAKQDGSGRERAEVTISAAASLTDAFDAIATAFEAEHDGVTVALNFGPSDGLAGQIKEGAPVDVFASASATWMDSVANDGPGVERRAEFARNELAIIVPRDNPAGIRSLEDLTNDGVQLVLAAEGVPAGDYAREVFEDAGISEPVLANLVSNEEDARAVVSKVLAGDADAGVTYATDVTPDVADEIMPIAIPDDVNVIATYSIAVVSGSDEAELARRFVDFVLADGQERLREYGFLTAP